MGEKRLEYRMFGLVPYNLSPIQQGIQFGHAVQEYNNKVLKDRELKGINRKDFIDWAHLDKTFIILNGGTTNNNYVKERDNVIKYKGSLNRHLRELLRAGVEVAYFDEPDLGDQLTAVVFLVDERVWDMEKHPEFDKSMYYPTHPIYRVETIHNPEYKKWVKSIGGETNLWLREFLRQFKLA